MLSVWKYVVLTGKSWWRGEGSDGGAVGEDAKGGRPHPHYAPNLCLSSSTNVLTGCSTQRSAGGERGVKGAEYFPLPRHHKDGGEGWQNHQGLNVRSACLTSRAIREYSCCHLVMRTVVTYMLAKKAYKNTGV